MLQSLDRKQTRTKFIESEKEQDKGGEEKGIFVFQNELGGYLLTLTKNVPESHFRCSPFVFTLSYI
jgi:hypothetical protein